MHVGEFFRTIDRQSFNFSNNASFISSDLPVISNRPEVTKTTLTTVTLSWKAWGVAPTDTGDGPVIEYRVYYSNFIFNDDDVQWILTDTVPSGDSAQIIYETTIRGLLPSVYTFYVTAVREDGGEGPPSLTVQAITFLQSSMPPKITLGRPITDSGRDYSTRDGQSEMITTIVSPSESHSITPSVSLMASVLLTTKSDTDTNDWITNAALPFSGKSFPKLGGGQ